MNEPTNLQRGAWALAALNAFIKRQEPKLTAQMQSDEDRKDAITDLIADLYHYAKAEGYTAAQIEEMHERAFNYFIDEVTDNDTRN